MHVAHRAPELVYWQESTRESLLARAKIIRMHTAEEVAGALGGADGLTTDVIKYPNQVQTEGSVTITHQDKKDAEQSFQQDGISSVGMFHTHIEALHHAHGPSTQDLITFRHHEVNEIAYLRKDGSIDIKAYNYKGQQIKQRIGSEITDVLTISASNTISANRSKQVA